MSNTISYQTLVDPKQTPMSSLKFFFPFNIGIPTSKNILSKHLSNFLYYGWDHLQFYWNSSVLQFMVISEVFSKCVWWQNKNHIQFHYLRSCHELFNLGVGGCACEGFNNLPLIIFLICLSMWGLCVLF